MAAAEALREARRPAGEPSGGHPQLLPHESADGSGRGRERQHQIPAAPRAGLYQPPLSAAEGTTDGGDQNRIRRFQESRLKCASRQIPAENQKEINVLRRLIAYSEKVF